MLKQAMKPTESGMRVLVVDDDPIFRSLVSTKLARCGHEVCEAEDGGVAWSIVAGTPVQLALVDLEMPNFKGIELIRCIRAHPRTCRIPIVVITSRNDADAVRGSLEAGATSFMTKPLNWSMFSNHIDFLLRLHGAAERGHAAEERVAEMAKGVHELVGKLVEITERIAAEASRALEGRRALGGEMRMAAALETIVRDACQARERFAEVLQPAEELTPGGQDAATVALPLHRAF